VIELVEHDTMDAHRPCFWYSPLPDSCKDRIEFGADSACDYLINEGDILSGRKNERELLVRRLKMS